MLKSIIRSRLSRKNKIVTNTALYILKYQNGQKMPQVFVVNITLSKYSDRCKILLNIQDASLIYSKCLLIILHLYIYAELNYTKNIII